MAGARSVQDSLRVMMTELLTSSSSEGNVKLTLLALIALAHIHTPSVDSSATTPHTHSLPSHTLHILSSCINGNTSSSMQRFEWFTGHLALSHSLQDTWARSLQSIEWGVPLLTLRLLTLDACVRGGSAARITSLRNDWISRVVDRTHRSLSPSRVTSAAFPTLERSEDQSMDFSNPTLVDLVREETIRAHQELLDLHAAFLLTIHLRDQESIHALIQQLAEELEASSPHSASQICPSLSRWLFRVVLLAVRTSLVTPKTSPKLMKCICVSLQIELSLDVVNFLESVAGGMYDASDPGFASPSAQNVRTAVTAISKALRQPVSETEARPSAS